MMKRRLLIALLVVCVLTVLGAYSLPAFLNSVLVSKIQQATGKTVTLASVQFSPLPLAINLQQLTLQEHNAQPFASIENSYVTLSIWQSLQQHALVVDQLILTKPVVHIVQHQDGHFNYDDLFKNAPDDAQNTPLFPVTINKLSLLNGTLKWDAAAIKETIENIELTASNISTTTDSKSQLQLQLNLASGGYLNWQAEASLNPLRSTGHIELKQLKLPPSLGVDLTGQGLFSSDYQLHYAKQRFDFTAEHAKLELHDFKYSDKNQLVIKTPEFKHESDIVISYADNALSLVAKHSKIKLLGFAMSGNSPEINIAEFNHATDLTINYQHEAWRGTVANSTLEAQGLQLVFPNSTLKIPHVTLNSAINTEFANSKLQLSSTQGQLNGRNVQLLANNQDKPMLEMPTLNAQGVDFNFNDRFIGITSLTGDSAKARAWLNSAGQFNYPMLFPEETNNSTANTPATASDNASSSTPWTVKVKQFALTQAEIAFADQQQNPPVNIKFAPVNFKLNDYNNQTGTKLPFELTTGVNNTGSIQLTGNSVFAPFSMQLLLNAEALDLVPFQAYFEKMARLDIVKGQFATKGELSINVSDNKPLALKFAGDASIAQLVTRDQIQHQDFITWKNLTLKSLAVDLAKNDYSAAALTLDKLYTRVTVNKNKTINFSDIFINKTPAKNGKEKTATAKASDMVLPFTFKLAKLKVLDGSSDFTDNSLILPFEAQIDHLSGGASDISSDKKSSIKVSLKGSAYDLSPVDIDGEVSPYLGNYDLNVNFVEMPMPLISPYMVQFAGYKVEKGKMTLKLKYKVFGDQLNASNNIMIDQFELGEKVENPNAVSLPLELGVALLKDSDGKIKIDVPITGSMNSPEFDMGAVISDALVNALGKVISSPFTALAELIGEDAEEISTVRFNAGKAELDNKQQQELAAIANLLKQNSSLVLDIKGKAFQKQDWPAIREAALYDELKKLRAQEINQYQDNNVILPQYIQLSDSEYRRLLAELFIAKFPKLAKKSLLGTPELIDSKAGDFYEVAKQHLSADITLDLSRLRELAIQRARAIASYLVQLGVTSDQLFILDPTVESKKDTKELLSLLALRTR
jgi:hypothetical protein